ncbi:MAG: YtxH domain-containing protein, partial [Candidatus Aminicenantaceae bacterium]
TLSFLLGAATGFILGVLFAPSSGEETRRKIQERAEKAGEQAKEKYSKIQTEAEKGMKTAKEKAQVGMDSIKDFVEKKKTEYGKKTPEDLPKENK